MEKVILVDKKDREIGKEEKIKAHLTGKLHRALSVFIFNKKGQLLIQKRAESKYHSGGLWANTCCSHPRPGENLISAAKRRLKEEMGIECNLKEVFSFIYKAKLGNLTENEFDHVVFGQFNGKPKPDKNEVEDWQWVKFDDFKKDLIKSPEKYVYWLKIILKSKFFKRIAKDYAEQKTS